MSKSQFSSNLKTTLAFGGMQIISVLVSILRGKMVAVLLGPTGMGINNLYLSTINMLSTFSGFGLELSAVREISEAAAAEDRKRVNKDVSIVSKIFLYTGIFGSLITLVLSHYLSIWTFGNDEHTFSFIILSLFVFFTALLKFQQTVLRGLRHIGMILKSGIYGAIVSLVFTFPVYYYLREDGIVWGIVIGVLSTFIVSSFYYYKIKPSPVDVAQQEIITKGKSLISFGIMLVIAVLIGLLAKFIISVYIGKVGNIKDVGYYTAAIGISAQYIGFILSSLSADYFPRISAVHANRVKLNKIVNEQMEIVLLLSTPLLIIMLITSPLLIRLFLSKEFLVITDFIRFIALGSFFQVASYCQGYISFAKNDKKTYFFLEGVYSNIQQVVSTLICYKIWGLNGLGIAFFANYFVYFFIINIAVIKLYRYRIHSQNWKVFLMMLAFMLSAFLIFYILKDNIFTYGIATTILIGNLYVCYILMSKKIDIKSVIASKFSKK